MKKYIKNLKVYIKEDKTIIKFGDTEIKKQNFRQHKTSNSINNIDINKIVASNKVSFGKTGFEYIIGYKDAKKLSLYAFFFQKRVCHFYKR